MTSLSFAKEDTIPEVVYFPGALTAQLSLVGGKGQSLIRMAQIGLPTPPGFVLTVAFFEPWLAELKLTKEWKAFCQADELDLESCSKALKERATKLELTREQSQRLMRLLPLLKAASSLPSDHPLRKRIWKASLLPGVMKPCLASAAKK